MFTFQYFQILALCLLVIVVAPRQASAIDDQEWHYEWSTASGAPMRVKVAIPGVLIEKAFVGKGDLLNEKIIGKRIIESAKSYAASLSDNEVNVAVLGESLESFEIKTARRSGNTALALDRQAMVNAFIQREVNLISANSYYRYDPVLNAIVIEYNAVIRDYQSIVLDTLSALAKNEGMLQVDDLRAGLLDMLQSIPYLSLSDADFPLNNPVRLLLERQGDCESKQLFLAAGLKLLYPQDSIYLVLLPTQEHIVLMQRDASGRVIYMDATGPGRLPPGESLEHFSVDEGILYEVNL